jgi:hypothetical protein
MEPRNRFPAWRACTTTLFDVPARQATEAGGIDSWAPEMFEMFTNSGSGAGERLDYCPLTQTPDMEGTKNPLTIYSHSTISGQI